MASMNLVRKVRLLLQSFYLDVEERKFIRHNHKVWKNVAKGSRPEVLVEATTVPSTILSFSYLVNILAQVHNAEPKLYFPNYKSFKKGILDFKTKLIFKSFNVGKPFYISCSSEQKGEADSIFNAKYSQLTSKKEVEDLEVDGVWLGDLIYDSYLRRFNLPTIEIDSQQFKDLLYESIIHYIFWRDYFKTKNVEAVVLTHCVYFHAATVLRVAVRQNVPVYQCNAQSIYALTPERLRSYVESHYFKKSLQGFTEKEILDGKKLAKEQLKKRFRGEVGVDMPYSTKSAFGEVSKGRVLKQSQKIKVLIATHCFFDSPHTYGNGLFTDFYEWLNFLGEISEQTDYEWYLKTHADFLPGNIAILEKLIKNFPKFKLIPADTSHHQIIKDGIDFALTVYGTIGFEYAALGKKVINASPSNPHQNYSFNLNPSSVDEYRDMLMRLEDLEFKIDQDEVYEYYFLKFLNSGNSWIMGDFEEYLAEIGGFTKMKDSRGTYTYFLNKFSDDTHLDVIKIVEHFLKSGEYHLQKKHIVNVKNNISAKPV